MGEPQPLPERINRLRPITEVRLGPDAHTLYFSSSFVQPPHFPKDPAATREGLRDMQRCNDGNDHIWQVDISDVLAAHAANERQPLKRGGNEAPSNLLMRPPT